MKKYLLVPFMCMSFAALAQDSTKAAFTISSPAFKSNDTIPAKYTCKRENVNPELDFANIPKGAKSFAIIVDDPDAPKGNFDHWLIWNIPVRKQLKENSAPGTQGKNGAKENKYTGPCPPGGTHHYHFKVYALDTILGLPEGTDKKALEAQIKKHTVGMAELTGLFKK